MTMKKTMTSNQYILWTLGIFAYGLLYYYLLDFFGVLNFVQANRLEEVVGFTVSFYTAYVVAFFIMFLLRRVAKPILGSSLSKYVLYLLFFVPIGYYLFLSYNRLLGFTIEINLFWHVIFAIANFTYIVLIFPTKKDTTPLNWGVFLSQKLAINLSC